MKHCKLEDIVDALETQTEMHSNYLDTTTGEIILLSEDELYAAESGEFRTDHPEWLQKQIELAHLVLEDTNNRFIQLPSKFDVHEYSIMERFCRKFPDTKLSDALCELIQGSGAFSRFKNAIHQYGIQDEWYDYKQYALVEIAKDWCESHGIAYTMEESDS